MKSQSGLTLIEIIIYIGLVAFISTSAISLYIQILQLRQKSVVQQELTQTLRYTSSRLDHEIKNALSIIGVGSSLSLRPAESSRQPTTFSLVGGRIIMGVGGSFAPISSNLVTINSFDLTNLSSGDSLTQNIRYRLTGSYLDANATITNSIELRSK